MNIQSLRESRFLKKEDCDTGVLFTICKIEQENVARDDEPADMKWVLYGEEFEKGLVLNSTNAQLIASILKSDDTDDWIAKKGTVVLFNDPSVGFAGKVMGGIRVRAPRSAAAERSAV